MHRPTVRRLLPAAGVLLLAACSDSPTATEPTVRTATTLAARGGDRLATVEYEGRSPALFIQDAEGKNRFRVHFRGVYDRVDGNYPQRILPTTDETIRALGPAKWSPDGSQLAIVVTLGFDQSQVVVMNADGHNIRVASPNGQIILGDIDWSPDGGTIAYSMSTLPHAQGVDLFTTDLRTFAVSRLTKEGRIGVFDEYRFDNRGGALWLTRFDGYAEDNDTRLYRLLRVGLDGSIEETGARIVGNPQGIARDGSFVLTIRPTDRTGWGWALVRQPLGGAEETAITAGALQYAELLEGDVEAVVAKLSPEYLSSYELFGVDTADDHRGALSVSPSIANLAFIRGTR